MGLLGVVAVEVADTIGGLTIAPPEQILLQYHPTAPSHTMVQLDISQKATLNASTAKRGETPPKAGNSKRLLGGHKDRPREHWRLAASLSPEGGWEAGDGTWTGVSEVPWALGFITSSPQVIGYMPAARLNQPPATGPIMQQLSRNWDAHPSRPCRQSQKGPWREPDACSRSGQ